MHVFGGKESNNDNLPFIFLSNEPLCWISKWPPFKITFWFNSFTGTRGLSSKVACSGEVFTAAAVDNIDHDPSVTTSADSFHGTVSSLIHPSYTGEGVNQSIVIARESKDAGSKTVAPLQLDYTEVPPLQAAYQVLV